MAFTVSGQIDGRPSSASWDAGELDGEAAAVARVLELVRYGETVTATPTGPAFTAALEPDYVALITLVNAFQAASEILVAGDVPEIPEAELPDGAVA